MPSTTPITVYDDICSTYLRYVDTAYWLRSEEVMAERRRLLEEDKTLFTEPLIEPVVPYDSTVPLLDIAKSIGLDPLAADRAGDALFGEYRSASNGEIMLRTHQAEVSAVAASRCSDGPQCRCYIGHGIGKDRGLPLARPSSALR